MTGDGLSFREVRATAYPREKAAEERLNNPASYFVYRRLSWPLTALAVRMGATPLWVSMMGLVLTLLGMASLCIGRYVEGAILLNVAMVLDQVDGNVARATGRISTRGAVVDSLVGLLYSSLLPWSVGVSILVSPEIPGVLFLSQSASVALVFTGSIAILSRKVVVEIRARAGGDREFKSRQALLTELYTMGKVARLSKAINSLSLIALLGAAFLNVVLEFTLLYSAYQLLLLAGVVTAAIRSTSET